MRGESIREKNHKEKGKCMSPPHQKDGENINELSFKFKLNQLCGDICLAFSFGWV